MLLRFGVIAMSVSIVLALVVVAVVTLRDRPEEVVAAEPAAAKPEPESRPEQDPRDKMLDLPSMEPEPAQAESAPKPSPEPKSGLEPETASGEKARPAQEPAPAPDPSSPSSGSASRPASSEQPEVAQGQNPLPQSDADWPAPATKEIKAASKPRRYSWTNGAIMSLTVDALGIYNAPVMGSDTQAALSRGVGHVPETSLPWDRSPQTNVYLAAHRYGWPNTESRLLFFNLNKLGRGDEVVLKNRQGKTYRYRVRETLVVDPNDRWVMGQVVGKHMLTLQTCTPIPTFEKRLIVRADRV